ncbi:uncharacterized protein LOC135448268 isoform X2 [Zonotrichia leucophrys gambelii]|uniref:uncharacterized protein LOC135448268 isoform X2 n=1 Tax=Zonotrichia leucophrys gambelii TaxID=257770 RepID=UPI0031404F46
MKGPSLETQMVDDETEPASEELPPHLREEPPEDGNFGVPESIILVKANSQTSFSFPWTAWTGCGAEEAGEGTSEWTAVLCLCCSSVVFLAFKTSWTEYLETLLQTCQLCLGALPPGKLWGKMLLLLQCEVSPTGETSSTRVLPTNHSSSQTAPAWVPFHELQSFKNSVQPGSAAGPQVQPANLLQPGLPTPWVLQFCQEPVSAWASSRAQPPLGIHLLQPGILWAAGGSLHPLHGLQGHSCPAKVCTTGSRGM